jgi:hypothetical protein
MSDTPDKATALNEAMAANYLLVDLAIRSWSGKSTDRTASKEVLANKGAADDGGVFVKNLLSGAKQELKEVHTLGNALRSFVYNRTLSWSSTSDGARRGERLLASTAAMDFIVELNGLKKDYDRSVLALQAVWAQRVAEAMRNLAGLADANDYPDASQIPSLFSVNVNLRTVPAIADFSRLNVPAELAEALGQRSASQAEIQVANALKEMQERFLEELERVAEQFARHGAGEKTRLYSTLVTNMQGLVQMARNMNLSQNPKLAEFADKIEQRLLSKPIESYRDDPMRAKAAAEDARALLAEAQLPDVWA